MLTRARKSRKTRMRSTNPKARYSSKFPIDYNYERPSKPYFHLTNWEIKYELLQAEAKIISKRTSTKATSTKKTKLAISSAALCKL